MRPTSIAFRTRRYIEWPTSDEPLPLTRREHERLAQELIDSLRAQGFVVDVPASFARDLATAAAMKFCRVRTFEHRLAA